MKSLFWKMALHQVVRKGAASDLLVKGGGAARSAFRGEGVLLMAIHLNARG